MARYRSDPITTAMPVTEEECMPPMSMLPPPSEYHKEYSTIIVNYADYLF